MDDLSEKLAELLNDPDSMNRVRQMAESLLGEQAAPEPQQQSNDFSGLLNGAGMLNGDELRSVMSIISRLKSAGNDSRSQLLTALKPHLSEPRREKVDTAIKILKLIELFPYIKESGLLKL